MPGVRTALATRRLTPLCTDRGGTLRSKVTRMRCCVSWSRFRSSVDCCLHSNVFTRHCGERAAALVTHPDLAWAVRGGPADRGHHGLPAAVGIARPEPVAAWFWCLGR